MFKETATTEIYARSLHDALPIFRSPPVHSRREVSDRQACVQPGTASTGAASEIPPSGDAGVSTAPHPAARLMPITTRSEEHTSELQPRQYIVCRLLLVKK